MKRPASKPEPPPAAGRPGERPEADQLVDQALGLIAQDGLEDAEQILRTVLHRWPEHPRALNNLGLLRGRAGARDEALALLERACAVGGGTAKSWANLGRAYLGADRLEDATAALRRSVELAPDLASSWLSLGEVAERTGLEDQALGALTQACTLQPDSAACHNNLALLLQRLGRLPEALEHLDHAVRLDRTSAPMAWNHGDLLRRAGRLGAARSELERAIGLDPTRHEPWLYLAMALSQVGEVQNATVAARRARDLAPDHDTEAGSTFLFLASHDDSIDAESLAREHRSWGASARARASGARIVDVAPRRASPEAVRSPAPRRVVVGYLSADFKEHVVARFLEPVLAAHDPTRVQVVLLSDTQGADHVTERLAHKHRFVDLRAIDLSARRLRILEERLDVLVDVGGHTSESSVEILAERLAPLQITWLGYPGSTGLDTIDLRITDSRVDPPGVEADYVERLARLARPPWAYPVLETYDLPTERPEGQLVMGSFNRLGKLSPTIVEAWCLVLERVPTARLVLRAREAAHPATIAGLTAMFTARGLDERVELRPWAPTYRGALSGIASVDVALDSFPYHGTTSTCDALAVGTPVVSLLGTTPASRVAPSLLGAVGLDHLVAPDVDGFVERIVKLAADVEGLRASRDALKARYAAGPLSDAVGLARALEEIYGSVDAETDAQRV